MSDDASRIIEKIARYPVYIDARFTSPAAHSLGQKKSVQIECQLRQRDLIIEKKRKLYQTVHVSADSVQSTTLMHNDTVAFKKQSPLGERTVILRQYPDGSDSRQSLEVWTSNNSLATTIDLSNIHGKFYDDDDAHFGCLSWSADIDGGNENLVVYAAQPQQPGATDSLLNEDWGEKHHRQHPPLLYCVNIDTGAVNQVPIEGLSPGQAVCGIRDNTVILTGYSHFPRKYGVHACTNRLTAIYQCNLDGSDLVRLSNNQEAARDPRLNRGNQCLYYLANDIGGPHDACSRLMEHNLVDGSNRIVLDVVRDTRTTKEFPGLFKPCVPDRCFFTFQGRSYIVLSTLNSFQMQVFAVCIDPNSAGAPTHPPVMLTGGLTDGSYTACDVVGNRLLVLHSDFGCLPTVMIGEIAAIDAIAASVSWLKIPGPDLDTEWRLPPLTYHIHSFRHMDTDIEYALLEQSDATHSIFREEDHRALIVMPHGGPHSAFRHEYSFHRHVLTLLGYRLLLVNYAGSVGCGDNYVRKLVGQIGTLDVEQVHAVANHVVRKENLNSGRVFLSGGSHGGFIAAHLIGSHPNAYRGCIMQNPVISIADMVSDTDIPDWCFAELGLAYDLRDTRLPDPETFAKMHNASPIRNVDKVHAPTLLMLGEVDRRVPPSQGLAWYHRLHATGKPIQLKVYADTGHSLDSVNAEVQGILHIVEFLAAQL